MIKIVGESHLPQLLLIHGGGVGPWMWDEAVSLLEAHYRLLIVTLPYHGEANVSLKPFTIKDYTPLLIQEVKSLRTNEPIGVVGFSLGAQIAIELISIEPAFFSFAMINSAACTSIQLPFPILKWLTKMTIPLAKLKSFAMLQAKTLYIPDHMFKQYYQLSSSMPSNELLEILHTNMNFRVSPVTHSDHCSVHITYGELENNTIKKSAHLLKQLFPHSNTYIVSRIGHGFPLAEPKLFANYIIEQFPKRHK